MLSFFQTRKTAYSLEIAQAFQAFFKIFLSLPRGLRRRLDVRLIKMAANCQKWNIAEGNRPKIAQVAVRKDHTRDNIRVHAVIGAPVVSVGLHRNRGDFAESRFSGGAGSGRVPNYKVRAEAGVRAGIDFVLGSYPLNNWVPIGVLPIQQFFLN